MTHEYHKDYAKKRRLGLKKRGMCLNCHKNKAAEGKTCCDRCLLKKRINTINRIYATSSHFLSEQLKKQGGVCAICLRIMVRVNVDHCHKTGKIRGLLCTACNTAIGKLGDDSETLRRAADYIETFAQTYQQPNTLRKNICTQETAESLLP